MKKINSVLIAVFIILNFSLLIGYAQEVDFTYEETFDGIEIINPEKDIIYSDYLLISVKIKENITCKFSLSTDVAEEKRAQIKILSETATATAQANSEETEKPKQTEITEKAEATEGIQTTQEENIAVEVSDLLYGPEKIEKSDQLKFYAVQLENLLPGQYEIKIEVLDEEEVVTHTISKIFNIEDKSMMPEETVDEDIFKEDNKGIEIIQNLIKSIFGN